jgi:hypothetical protein
MESINKAFGACHSLVQWKVLYFVKLPFFGEQFKIGMTLQLGTMQKVKTWGKSLMDQSSLMARLPTFKLCFAYCV